MLFNPKALFYVYVIINLNAGDSVAGTTFSLGVFPRPPSSLTLSVFHEAAGTRGCFLLAASSVLQGHSAVLLQSKTCDWTWHGGVARGDMP